MTLNYILEPGVKFDCNNKDMDKPTRVTSEVLQNYVISWRYYFSYRQAGTGNKFFTK